jgi:rod shape-determining protein MreD
MRLPTCCWPTPAGELSRRILWFPGAAGAARAALAAGHPAGDGRRAPDGGGAEFPGWGCFPRQLQRALLWFPLTFVLLLPQYQPIERDDNRPI